MTIVQKILSGIKLSVPVKSSVSLIKAVTTPNSQSETLISRSIIQGKAAKKKNGNNNSNGKERGQELRFMRNAN